MQSVDQPNSGRGGGQGSQGPGPEHKPSTVQGEACDGSPPDREPVAGTAPPPVFLLVAMFGLVYWGLDFLDRNAGGFHPVVYEPHRSYAQVDALNPKANADDILAARGQQIYGQCALCHQLTGRGEPGKAPPLAGSDWVNAPGPERLIRIVLHGLQGPIQVNGVEWNLAMASWKDSLKDEEIAAVLTFIRRNKAWGNSADAVTPGQVQAIREAEANRSEAWTGEELQRIPVSQ